MRGMDTKPDYRIVDLGEGVFPKDINDLGWVVGVNSGRWAFVYENGRMRELGRRSGRGSAAHAIDNSGRIVGALDRGVEMFIACEFEGDQATPLLSHPLAIESRAFGVNAAGHVVGAMWDPGVPKEQREAYPFCRGTNAETLPRGTDRLIAVRINNSGQILLTSPDWVPVRHSAICRDGKILWVLPPSGYTGVVGHDLNDNGDIAGALHRDDSEAAVPFARINGILRPLCDKEHWGSAALGLNDAGQVVGRWVSDARGCAACLLDPQGGEWALLDLIPADAGWEDIDAALAINERGDIVGWGRRSGQTHGFLMVAA